MNWKVEFGVTNLPVFETWDWSEVINRILCSSLFIGVAKLYFQKGLGSLCACSIPVRDKESYTLQPEPPSEQQWKGHINSLNSGSVKGTLETMKPKTGG